LDFLLVSPLRSLDISRLLNDTLKYNCQKKM
jgi:hypothetical protein